MRWGSWHVAGILLTGLGLAGCGGGSGPIKRWENPAAAYGLIQGWAVDVETGQPIAGAEVVVSTGQRVRTRADGQFEVMAPAGRARVQVESQDYVVGRREVAIGGVTVPTAFKLARKAPAQKVGRQGGTVVSREAALEFMAGAFASEASVSFTYNGRARIAATPAPPQFVDESQVPRRVLATVAVEVSETPAVPARMRVPVPDDATAEAVTVYRANDNGEWVEPINVDGVAEGVATISVRAGGIFGVIVNVLKADQSRVGYVVFDKGDGKVPEGEVISGGTEVETASRALVVVDPQGTTIEVAPASRALLEAPAQPAATPMRAPTAAPMMGEPTVDPYAGRVRTRYGTLKFLVAKRKILAAEGVRLEVVTTTARFEAVGTAFSVASCEGGGSTVDTLEVVEGSVRVQRSGAAPATVMAGRSATFCRGCVGSVAPSCAPTKTDASPVPPIVVDGAPGAVNPPGADMAPSNVPAMDAGGGTAIDSGASPTADAGAPTDALDDAELDAFDAGDDATPPMPGVDMSPPPPVDAGAAALDVAPTPGVDSGAADDTAPAPAIDAEPPDMEIDTAPDVDPVDTTAPPPPVDAAAPPPPDTAAPPPDMDVDAAVPPPDMDVDAPVDAAAPPPDMEVDAEVDAEIDAAVPVDAPDDAPVDMYVPPDAPSGPDVPADMFTMDADQMVPMGVALSISPSMHDYGYIPVGGNSAEVTFTVSNVGTGPAPTPAISLKGPYPGDYEITVNNCTAPLALSGSCTVNVRFKPTVTGSRNADLEAYSTGGTPMLSRLYGNGGSGPADAGTGAMLVGMPTMLDFGPVAKGTTSPELIFEFKNVGGGATGQLSAVTVATTGEITLTYDGCSFATLAPGGGCMMKAKFAPTSAGMQSATVSTSATPGGAANVNLKGTGTDGLVIMPWFQDFGFVTVNGTSSMFGFTVRNDGASMAGTMAGATLGGTEAGDFMIVSDTCVAMNLQPAGMCNVAVTFKPTATGLRTGLLTVMSPLNGSVSADLRGTGQ